MKTTSPVLPWIGVIVLGYAAGPRFLPGVATHTRERRFADIGSAMLFAFALLRLVVDALDDATLSKSSGPEGNQIRVLSLPRYAQDGGAED